MTPTELRALAETLEHECALRLIAGGKNHEEAQACEQAADYLLACADEKPVAKITRAGSGSIAMFAPDGGPFDMSKYIGAALFTQPAPATAQAEPKREPLSEKQIDAIHELWYERAGMSFADVVRAVERAHGIIGDSDACR